MKLPATATKVRRRLVHRWVYGMRRWPRLYPLVYRSYWHMRRRRQEKEASGPANHLTAEVNPGAGIGHQLANWIAGHWFARMFRLEFAHSRLPDERWDSFLGLGRGDRLADDLIAAGARRVRLPLFDENDPGEVARTKRIIAAYRGRPTVFVLERDQFYRAQTGVIPALQEKYWSAPARDGEPLLFRAGAVAIAVHIRRGDVTAEAAASNANLALRYQSESYFAVVLEQALQTIRNRKGHDILIFSQDPIESPEAFERFGNVRFCVDMGARPSFAHMAAADILIASKSSFSYKPALLNRGVKIVPTPFWHDYPDSPDWIEADAHGTLDLRQLERAVDTLLGARRAQNSAQKSDEAARQDRIG